MDGGDLLERAADAPRDRRAGLLDAASERPRASADPQRTGERIDERLELGARLLGPRDVVRGLGFVELALQLADAIAQAPLALGIEHAVRAIARRRPSGELEAVHGFARSAEQRGHVRETLHGLQSHALALEARVPESVLEAEHRARARRLGARQRARVGIRREASEKQSALEGFHLGGVAVRIDVQEPAQRLAGLGLAPEGDALAE